MKTLTLDLRAHQAPTRDLPSAKSLPDNLPTASLSHGHPTKKDTSANASLFFIGTATTILEWEGLRLMTDPYCFVTYTVESTLRSNPGTSSTLETMSTLGPGSLAHAKRTQLLTSTTYRISMLFYFRITMLTISTKTLSNHFAGTSLSSRHLTHFTT